ncbi:MAG: peptidylprolyl isomerase [Candidatus Accumulibacter sp.]|jgi:peptidyl-prolyl cis-trans isomerase C|nr:peptidylprolyl isomerase [Accumulibacter sp.]
MHKSMQIAAALVLGASLSMTAMAADAVGGRRARASAASPSPAAASPATEAPFVKVNGVSISQDFADAFISEQKARGAPDSPELRNAVRDELIRRELLVQQAKKEKLDKKPEIAAKIEVARQAALIGNFVQQYLQKNPIKDEQLKAEYEKAKAQVGGTEYKARHILVKEESEAAAIIASLKKGAKFEELAKQSIDPGSKDNGGDLNWAPPGNYVKPFADALTGLEKGKYTETPVKSQFGYHVILLENTRPMTFPSFDELKPRLMQQAQAQQVAKMIDDLRAKAKVE